MKRWIIGLGLLTALAGCGLPDYQNRMDKQRERIQEIDEINALLDDPITMPTMLFVGSPEEKPAWPFDVYLRLPKGYGAAVASKSPYYINFAFFRFSAGDPGYNIFIVPAFVAEQEEKQEIGKYHAKNFRLYVRKSIEDFYAKTTKVNLTLPDKLEERIDSVKRFTPYPSEAKNLPYTVYEYVDTAGGKSRDPQVFRVHLHQEGDRQIAIVEHRPRAVNEAHDKAFRACLRTLDIGPDAATKRNQFRKARG